MNLRELLDRILPGLGERNSRQEVKNRLKLILAHDRAAIEPDMLEAMRREILEVVSRYVDLDSEEMELTLDSSDRLTVLVANLPIRRVNPEFYTVKEETLTGAPLPEIVLDESLIGDPKAGANANAAEPAISPETAPVATATIVEPDLAIATSEEESAETAKARLEHVVIQDDQGVN